ncbi:MAG TPA: hypothetical protein VGL61_34595 [Kofleriaceae bacterium]
MRMRSSVVLAVASVASLAPAAHADDATPIDDATDDVPQCVDTNDVVGYRRCPEYGAWGENLIAPYVFVDIGFNVWHFTLPQNNPPVARAASSIMQPPASTSSEEHALTYDERVGVGFRYGLYVAFDFEIGAFGSQPSSSDLLALVSAGLDHRFGPITLGGELTGGVLAYSSDTVPGLIGEGVLDVRGRADLWLTPWLTIGGVLGKSVLGAGWMGGVMLGFHTHAFGRR